VLKNNVIALSASASRSVHTAYIYNNALFSSGFIDEGISITKSPYDNIFIMKRHPSGKQRTRYGWLSLR
jgi:hypothetical protein